MSSTARSTPSVRASSTASAPSPASATTSGPARVEDQPDAAAHQGVVVGQQDPDHGSARRRPAPGSRHRGAAAAAGASTASRPPISSARSRIPRMPGALVGRHRKPAAVVARPRSTTASPCRRSDSSDAAGPRVPGDVGQRLLRDPVEHQLRLAAPAPAARREAGDAPTPAVRGELGGQARPARCAGRDPPARPGRSRRATRGPRPGWPGRVSCTCSSSSRSSAGARSASRLRPSSTAVRLWPISSCSSWAIRCRSASWAASACALPARSASSRSSIALKLRDQLRDRPAARRGQPLPGRSRSTAHQPGQPVQRAPGRVAAGARWRARCTTSPTDEDDRLGDQHPGRHASPGRGPARACRRRTPAR